MGPGHGGPGEKLDDGSVAADKLASMGPGHGGPGETTYATQYEGNFLASMGPGHGGPGEGRCTDWASAAGGLQWGRATEGPESS